MSERKEKEKSVSYQKSSEEKIRRKFEKFVELREVVKAIGSRAASPTAAGHTRAMGISCSRNGSAAFFFARRTSLLPSLRPSAHDTAFSTARAAFCSAGVNSSPIERRWNEPRSNVAASRWSRVAEPFLDSCERLAAEPAGQLSTHRKRFSQISRSMRLPRTPQVKLKRE